MCGVVVRSGDYELKYARLDFVSRYTPTTMAACGANIAGNFRCGLSVGNHIDFYDNQHYMQAEWERVKSDKWYYERLNGFDVSRITADHHLFVSTREAMAVIRCLKKTRTDDNYARLCAIEQIVCEAGSKDIDNKVSVNTHLLYVSVAPIFAVNHLMYMWATTNTPKEYMAMLKNESQAAKQLQTVFRDDLSAVFELQVLRNRVLEQVNWEAEIDHRVNVDSMPIGFNEVRQRSAKIFKDARNEGAKAKNSKWVDYWAGRWSSMPGGSVVSQYEEDKLLKASLPREAKIKAAWFSANLQSGQKFWLDRVPSIFASTSTKYEWGKVRALYGCDVTSFLHSDYAMGDCENLLPSYFPVGKRANDKYIKRTIDAFRLGVPFCFDYDDFNSQHSTSSMKAVLTAWLDVYGGDICEDQVKSMRWTIDSLDDVTVSFNEVKETVKVNGTLMSGWRLTSFVNSVLNRVYLEKAGLKDNVIYALHNGDDMFATTQNMQQAVNVIRRAKAVGIRAQTSKTNIGTIGEFLRVDTRARNPTGAQYLARSVATAVHGRVETGAPNDLLALHGANNERVKAIVERGGAVDVAKALRSQLTEFECKLFEVGNEVLAAYEETHPVQGGGNLDAGVKSRRIDRVRSTTSEQFKESLQIINPGIDDYVDLVVRKFNLPIDKVSRKDVRSKAYDSLSRNRIRYETVIETDDRIQFYRGLYKAYAKSSFVAPISKLRSVGMANAKYLDAVRGPVAMMVAAAYNPAKLMAAIF